PSPLAGCAPESRSGALKREDVKGLRIFLSFLANARTDDLRSASPRIARRHGWGLLAGREGEIALFWNDRSGTTRGHSPATPGRALDPHHRPPGPRTWPS